MTTMTTYIYEDKDNFYPICQLDWQGPGYYASRASGSTFQMFQVEPIDYEGPWPTLKGYGTTVKVQTVEEAVYGKFVRSFTR
jgi:hypothetical protein